MNTEFVYPQLPYSDDYMTFDAESNRYILTAKFALEQLGLNLADMVNERNAQTQQIAVSRILRQISNQIYNFIHLHCIGDALRDMVIAKCPTARKIIQEAMGEQLLYVAMKGDLSRSVDERKRALAIDENAKATLLRTIPEVGYSLLYTGC